MHAKVARFIRIIALMRAPAGHEKWKALSQPRAALVLPTYGNLANTGNALKPEVGDETAYQAIKPHNSIVPTPNYVLNR